MEFVNGKTQKFWKSHGNIFTRAFTEFFWIMNMLLKEWRSKYKPACALNSSSTHFSCCKWMHLNWKDIQWIFFEPNYWFSHFFLGIHWYFTTFLVMNIWFNVLQIYWSTCVCPLQRVHVGDCSPAPSPTLYQPTIEHSCQQGAKLAKQKICIAFIE